MARIKFHDKQRTGNVGLFYICYKLARRGWNVLPTIKNARAVDIIAYNELGDKTISIQAKGYTNTESVGSFSDKEKIIADYYVVANHVYENPDTYILTRREVIENLTENKNGFWLEKSRKTSEKYYMKPEFLESWEKIGYGFADDAEREKIKEIDNRLRKSE